MGVPDVDGHANSKLPLSRLLLGTLFFFISFFVWGGWGGVNASYISEFVYPTRRGSIVITLVTMDSTNKSGKRPSLLGCRCFRGLKKFFSSLKCICCMKRKSRKNRSEKSIESFEIVTIEECHPGPKTDSPLNKTPLAPPNKNIRKEGVCKRPVDLHGAAPITRGNSYNTGHLL